VSRRSLSQPPYPREVYGVDQPPVAGPLVAALGLGSGQVDAVVHSTLIMHPGQFPCCQVEISPFADGYAHVAKDAERQLSFFDSDPS